VFDGYFHPRFDSDTATAGTNPTGPTIDPYDRSTEVGDEKDEECGTATRT
jgi:hypothetical protein